LTLFSPSSIDQTWPSRRRFAPTGLWFACDGKKGKDRQKGVHLGTQSTSDWDLEGTTRLSYKLFYNQSYQTFFSLLKNTFSAFKLGHFLVNYFFKCNRHSDLTAKIGEQ